MSASVTQGGHKKTATPKRTVAPACRSRYCL